MPGSRQDGWPNNGADGAIKKARRYERCGLFLGMKLCDAAQLVLTKTR